MIQVLIVEDQRMARENMESIVRSSTRYALSGTISDAGLALSFCERKPIDLILMDVCTLGRKDGISAAAEIKAAFPRIKIIIVTSMPEAGYLDRAHEAKVDSFWYKEVGALELIEVMDKTMAGESVWPDSTPHVQIGLASSEEFTPREIEVLYCIVQGKSVGEIADTLFIDYTTAKWHIKNLKEKVGARSIAELAVMAARTRLVMPEY